MERTRILVVDDAQPVRTILLHTLRALGFEAIEADCGLAALRLAHTAPPAIAMVDQWMPDITGAEVFRISSDPRVRSIIAIGLSGRPGSERELVAAGALAFLPKPFGTNQLCAALRQAVEALTPAASSAA